MRAVKTKASRQARGYGAVHVARRPSLAPVVRAGLVDCARCGRRIQPGEVWHLDHRDDRAGYLGAAHAVCNLRAAAAKTNEKRARTREPTSLRWSREWYVCAIIPERCSDTDVIALFLAGTLLLAAGRALRRRSGQ